MSKLSQTRIAASAVGVFAVFGGVGYTMEML